MVFQSNIFPERGTIYDFCFKKEASGSWIDWMDTIDKESMKMPANAKVTDGIIGHPDLGEGGVL